MEFPPHETLWDNEGNEGMCKMLLQYSVLDWEGQYLRRCSINGSENIKAVGPLFRNDQARCFLIWRTHFKKKNLKKF